MIKNLPDSDVTFVLMRNDSGAQEVAVKPLTQFPPEPFKDNPIDRYSGKQYKHHDISHFFLTLIRLDFPFFLRLTILIQLCFRQV